MQELMKNQYYNYNSLCDLALRVNNVYPLFQVDAFVDDVISKATATSKKF